MEEKTYKVTMELEVTAYSEDEAIYFALADANELFETETPFARAEAVHEAD